MDDYPCRGWRSVDEKGRFPPGQRKMCKLPEGVKPVTSPSDKEKMSWWGEVITVPVTDSIPKPTPGWPWILDTGRNYTTWMMEELPRKVRKFYLSMQMFDTEPYYHVKRPDTTPIWDCPVNDTLCATAANRKANADRRVEWNMIRLLQTRLRNCRANTVYREESPYGCNEGYEVLCGPLEETIKEMQAAFELKWGNIQSIYPNANLAQRAYMKQKNRFIEDRYRHRMMENMGADSNFSTVADSVSGQSPRWTIDGLDQRYIDCDWGKSIWDIHIAVKGDFEPGKTFDIERARAIETATKIKMEQNGEDYWAKVRERQEKIDEKWYKKSPFGFYNKKRVDPAAE